MERVVAGPTYILKALLGALVAVAVFLSFPKAFADKFNTETSSSARALGMGNVGVNTERGSYSLFYNPANLAAKDTKTQIQVLNFSADLNDGWASRAGGGEYSNFQNLEGLYGDLVNHKNTYVGGRFSIYPNVTVRHFSFGLLYEVNQGAEVRASDSALRVKARNRFGPTLGLSFRFFKGILRIGGAVQLLTVGNADTVVAQPITPSTLEFSRYINSGTGLSKSAGMTLTLPFRFLPSFSLVARDIGGTTYSGARFVKFGDGRNVAKSDMTFDLGTSLTIYLAKRMEMKLAMDYRDYVNQLDGGNFRHINLGTEISLYDVIKLRVGMTHGYMTYGFGINTNKASLDLAAYADEKDDRLRGSRDQRYVLQYTWNLGGGFK